MAAVSPIEILYNKNEKSHSGETNSLAGWNLNMNLYATKKTIAQGMLDIALLTANAAQLKHILLTNGKHLFYYAMLTLICVSIALQIIVGIGQLILASVDINHSHRHKMADILNNVVTCCVFIITVINVIISAFGIEGDIDNISHSETPIPS